MRQILYTRLAIKQLRTIQKPAASRIRAKIEQYARDPVSLAGDGSKLQEHDGYRLRIGDYRVIFDDDGRVMAVLGVRPRGDVCR